MEQQINQNQPTPQEGGDTLFFNVMPKAKAYGPMVGSTTEAKPTGRSFLPARGNMARTMKIMGIILVIAACGIGGYFGFSAWQNSKDQSNTNLPDIAPPTETPDNAENLVTTSKEWLVKYFSGEICIDIATCGDAADPDTDGLINKEEEQYATDPNNPDSDSDGLADGDEAHIFGGSPTNPKTAGNETYTDADDARGGYDTTNKGEKMTPERLEAVRTNLKQFGLHESSTATLAGFLEKYQSTEPAPASTPENYQSNVDKSPEAQLSRDTERLGTIRKLGIALFGYYTDAGYYPVSENYNDMISKIKPYNPVATNPTDPLNAAPYIYTYTPTEGGKDFTLTYQSETQNQLIKYTGTNAAKDAVAQGAGLNDDQRTRDLESLRQALLIYSAANTAGSQTYVFPTEAKYKTDLAPQYLQEIPKDPKTGEEYEYKVSKIFDSFTLKTALENPATGKTGYQCTQDACDNY